MVQASTMQPIEGEGPKYSQSMMWFAVNSGSILQNMTFFQQLEQARTITGANYNLNQVVGFAYADLVEYKILRRKKRVDYNIFVSVEDRTATPTHFAEVEKYSIKLNR